MINILNLSRYKKKTICLLLFNHVYNCYYIKKYIIALHLRDVIFNGCVQNAKLQVSDSHRATSGRSKAVNSYIVPQFFLPVARVQCFAPDSGRRAERAGKLQHN